MAATRQMEYRLRSIILFLMGGAILFQSACTTMWPIEKITHPTLSQEERADGKVFRSEEYMVYVLQGGETPVILAERFLGDTKKSWVIEEANEGIPFEKHQAIVIPLKEENKGGLTARGYQTVPVLSYHHFAEDCTSLFCMPSDVFKQQMKYLKENGYTVITEKELLDYLQYRRSLPKRSVMITIDDGYSSAYDVAYPILKNHGYTATLFIYTDYIGISDKAITWNQLKEMKDDGFQIGSHTISHCDLTKKREGEDETVYMARIKKELLGSKQIIDTKLKQNTISLAFPFGRYDESVLAVADQVGYRLGFSVKKGGNPFFADPLSLKRDHVLKKDMKSFITKLKTFYEFSLE